MDKKANEQWLANLAEITKKRKVENRISLVDCISDCTSLGEMQTLVASLISDYGVNAKVDFDSGHSNISEDIVVWREETDEEVNIRIDKEVEALLRKQAAISKQSTDLLNQMESLKAAKAK